MACGGAGQPTAVVITAIAGTAGVGKTALAVHWAHRMAQHFPDGQLYANLRGFDPSASMVSPAEAIRGFLDALGVPPQRIPDGLQAQEGLYRSLLAGRRVLVLLDNARDADQVRPLLPGAPGCQVLITSRDQLAGLVAVEDAHLLTLGVLTTAEARQLLAARLGERRVAAEPAALDEIVERCARLPLALAIVAARAATLPDFALVDLAEELRGSRAIELIKGSVPRNRLHRGTDPLITREGDGGGRGTRLDAFADDTATDVRAVFSWSYRTLGTVAARLFRLIGLHPGPDLSVSAAASLAGLPPARARSALAELTRAHLLAQQCPGRYSFHDLLRAYAAELAVAHDAEAERRAAIRRMLDHYRLTAHRADRLLRSGDDPGDPPAPVPGVTVDAVDEHDEAIRWFVTEHRVLLAAIWYAAESGGFERPVGLLARSITTFLHERWYLREWVRTQRLALDAWRTLSDPHGQACAHRELGRAYSKLGSYDRAHTHLRRALQLCRELDDHIGEGHTRIVISHALERQGSRVPAADHAERALELFRAVGDQAGLARALNAVGWCRAVLGDHRAALDYCQQALEAYQRIGNRLGVAHTWDSLGYAHHHLGRYDRAVRCYERALELSRGAGSSYYEAETLERLGDAHHAAGRPARARRAWSFALEIFNQVGHPGADQTRNKLKDVSSHT